MLQMRMITLFLFLLGVTCDSQMFRCDPQDQSSLLQLKHDLVFDSTWPYSKLKTWNSSSDCCVWDGVTCRADDGHVIALRLDGQSISGGINGSNSPLFDLSHLRLLDLSYNYFNGTHIPSGIGKLVNLLHLDLSNSFFGGQVPAEILSLTRLFTLDLSHYSTLFDEVRVSLKLERPKLSELVRNLTRLRKLKLSGVNMSAEGTLPEVIGDRTTLTELELVGCGFSGSITSIRWENLEKLVRLVLSNNTLNGTIPLSLFSLPSLSELDLSLNQFNDEVGEFPMFFLSPLRSLHLYGNKLEGPIPTSIFNLHNLEKLYLSNNNFSGTFDLSNLFKNPNLSEIDLSFNSLSVIESVGSTIYSSFPPQLESIYLASCNLKAFPFLLTNCSMLETIDLSDNNIVGEIPNWIWKPSLSDLNLSHNSLTGFEGPSPNLTFLSFLELVDLSSNLLQGQVPRAVYAPHLRFLSLSNNSFHGRIPPSLCNITADDLAIIKLSDNFFSGTIPPCLIGVSFGVLDLKRNNLSGNIPDAFPNSCELQTLDLSYNHLQGMVPKSMRNCYSLEVINLGNNALNDEFPFWLMDISDLRVLVLRSNKFYGPVRYETSKQASGWSKLQIIDIAANNFSGELPLQIFKFWTGMRGQMGNVQPKYDELGFGSNYQDTVVVINKGFFVELVKILTIFTTIDFSCNQFEGSIPPSIGDLTSLYTLNLSHNRFTGHIPSSFGNLKAIESLDLANNRINGVIPYQLASLTFISYLNLSYNQLVGKIPTSTQLQSFSKWSYIGNKGLYGPPLDEVSCGSLCGLPLDPTTADVGKEINWQLICAEIGYVIGLGAVIVSLLLWRRWRFWYFERVDRLLFWMFPRWDPSKRNHRKRA